MGSERIGKSGNEGKSGIGSRLVLFEAGAPASYLVSFLLFLLQSVYLLLMSFAE